MRFELTGNCGPVHFDAANAPNDCTKDGGLKPIFWPNMTDVVEQIPTKEPLLVEMYTNTRIKMSGCGNDEHRGLGAYGRDDRNDSGKRRSFAANCMVALANMFSSTRTGGIPHTHNGTSRMTVTG